MCIHNDRPRLFGINHSNRDYLNPECWGKNQFNSSFPMALACYMHSLDLPAVYVKTAADCSSLIDHVSLEEVFGINPLSDDVYFAFESQFLPYQVYVSGSIPRNDVVIMDRNSNCCLSSLEIKLTALPDNSTCELEETQYGSEIVVRPDTIIYLACSILRKYEGEIPLLLNDLGTVGQIVNDWSEINNILPILGNIKNAISNIVTRKCGNQTPIIMEPVWKTQGKSARLAENCLDIFVWSDLGLLNLFLPQDCSVLTSISRHTRSMVWLYKMLLDYTEHGYFNGAQVIDELSYNTKNDKAFSCSGLRTHDLMVCSELTHPRILKNQIKNIILGGGQHLLSPERRFDAIICSSPELFDD